MTHMDRQYHATYSTIVMCPETGETVAQGSGYTAAEARAAAKTQFCQDTSFYYGDGPDTGPTWDEHTIITDKDPVTGRIS